MGTETIGIIGAGQLGKMLAEAMHSMNIDFHLYDSQSDACGRTVGHLINGSFDDHDALDQLIAVSDLITCEFESVPMKSLEHIEQHTRLAPCSRAFAIARHRLKEKCMFSQLAIPCADSTAITSFSDLSRACQELGQPLLLKTCSGGYDGKGQTVILPDSDLTAKYEPFANLSCIAEQYIPFVEEISCILVRNAQGEIRTYPMTSNIHKKGILRLSRPQPNHPFEQEAIDYTTRIAEHLDYVGVLTLECFVTTDGTLLANEIAPRVHNSGHWTIEGSPTSQFENHIRALLAMPLGDTNLTMPTVMINLLGKIPTIASDSQTFIHEYGKKIKPKRKVGHITLMAEDEHALMDRARKLYSDIYSTEMPAQQNSRLS